MNTDDPSGKKSEADEGVICACLDRTGDEIREVVALLELGTFEEVAAALLAGSACTTCRPEIETILAELQEQGDPGALPENVDVQQAAACAEGHPRC